MPTQTTSGSHYKHAERFADFHSLLTFPKDCITSKMIQLSRHEEAFLVSCLKGDPLVLVKDYKLIRPIYEKNDLIPLKPIQRLNSLSESNGSLVISHGDHSLEFGRISAGEEGRFQISRFCQKTTEKSYKKMLFASSEDFFYGKNDAQIDFYDFKRLSKIARIDSRNVLLDFDKCPDEPAIVAYTDGCMNIVDLRESNRSIYKQKTLGNLVRWNPSIPYLMATSTPTSLQIFDIRYNSHQPVLNIQHANIHELCWSNTSYSDSIFAASRDRRTNLWSLRQDLQDDCDCRLSMTMNRFDLGSLTAGRSGFFYGLDASDSLIKIKIRPEYLESIQPPRFGSSLESNLTFCNDFESFQLKVLEMSREPSNYDKLKQFLMIATLEDEKPKKFDKNLVSSIKISNEFNEFKDLLIQSNGGSENVCLNFQKDAEFYKFIDRIRLKVRVNELIASNDFKTLRKLANLVTDWLCFDLNFFEETEAIKFMAFLLKNDRKLALTVLMKIVSSCPIGTPKILQIWIWMTIYPTIFDEKSFELIKIRPSLSKSLLNLSCDTCDPVDYLESVRIEFYNSFLLGRDNNLISQKDAKIIHQLHLNLNNLDRSLQTELCLLEEDSGELDKFLDKVNAAILGESDASFSIISAHLIKILLERSLKISSKSTFLTAFFLLSFRFEVLTERTPINAGIREFSSHTAFSRLKFLLNSAENGNGNIKILSQAINSIVTIGIDCYSTLSEDQLNYLAGQLQRFMELLEDFSCVDAEFDNNERIKSKEFRNQLKNLKNKLAI